jgi:hypothetical protein
MHVLVTGGIGWAGIAAGLTPAITLFLGTYIVLRTLDTPS